MDVVFMQETHSTKPTERMWSAEFGSKIWFSHGETNSAGVAILFSKKTDVTVHNTLSDGKGRYLMLYTSWQKQKVLFVNVYAPNVDEPSFFTELYKDIGRFTPNYILMGGDFNLALDSSIDRHGTVRNNNLSAKSVNVYIANENLIDVWRTFKEDTPRFTWRKLRPHPMFSRLDYWIISESLAQFINKVDLVPAFKTDHTMVQINLVFEPYKRRPGYWKLNTSLLQDSDYVEKINNLIEIQLEATNAEASHMDRLELLKLAVRGSSIQFSSRKKKSNKNKLLALEHKLQLLENEQINQGNTLFVDTENHIAQIRQEILELNRIMTAGAMMRSRARYANLSEKPTKYYLNLERRNYQQKTIYRLENEKGEIITNEKQVLQTIRQFYKNLYTSVGSIDTSYLDKLKIPRITDELKKELDSPITLKEMSEALAELENGKCPGTDGLDASFYKVFWNKLKFLMMDVYNEAISKGVLHLSARQSVISLLEKLDKNPLQLKSWRPLSLLNSDNKLYGKILALRLQKGLEKVIHHSQQGFMKGRYLSENIIKMQEIMHKCNREGINGCIISYDFLKAFDMIEWETLYAALRAFNFREGYIRMVRVLYEKPIAYTSNNGKWAEAIFPSQSTRQGCCFSPAIFTLAVEILGIAVRQNQKIKGFELNEVLIKSGQFADDLWTVSPADKESINETLQELASFQKFSGLTINPEKCAVIRIGPWWKSEVKYYTLKCLFWAKGPVKILGIWIHPDRETMTKINYKTLLEKAKKVLEAWTYRDMTLYGKVVIVNTLINSLFMHTLSAIPPPDESYFKEYRQSIQKFLWNDKPVRISHERMVQKYEKFGLKLIDIEQKAIAIKATWPVRWLKRETTELRWFYQYLPIKDERIWYCNTSPNHIRWLINRQDTSQISYDIWWAWSNINYKSEQDITTVEEILDQNVWGNSCIQRALSPLWDANIVNSNIDKIIDIYDPINKTFLQHEQVMELFGPVISHWDYLSIIAAIPKGWKRILKIEVLRDEIDIEPTINQLESMSKLSNRLYWQLIEEKYKVDVKLQSLKRI